ncbi:protein ERGIC-53-like isoform X2 [Nycticebus coucang]|uniref:protein ERGIC-53-like isoform X2 n=1 Tax=Nycticebus coucang TaxID=9470 RepID=UPI00234DC98F|nr:protein ERGIC-53-like isoform X2 [Nycticebus coucang]
MLAVSDPDALLCLLLLLAPHGAEQGHHPRRRFEYKLSFKGPRLALPGAGIPFWSHHGDTILGLEEVRLAPSLRNRSGAVWSRASVPFSAWEVEMQMRVTGPGRRGAQGMAVWYTRDRGHVGSLLGDLASWDGIGIFFNSSAEDIQVSSSLLPTCPPMPSPSSCTHPQLSLITLHPMQNSPAIRVLASDGHSSYEQLGAHRDGANWVLGSCHQDFRNRPHPFRVRITYWQQRLRVSNSGLTPGDPDEVCVDVGPLLLVSGGFFGVLAATSTLAEGSHWADDHDVLSFLTFSLSEPSPEPSPLPFLEMEQLRLERQLEGLRARLAVGTREDITPKPTSEALGDEERLFDLKETLDRHSRILQALQGLSKQLAQADRQWKQQMGAPGQARPEGGWDSVKVSTLLRGQQTLLQTLQAMRDAAARMASGAQIYLPVGTEHHFSELDQILSLLHKNLRSPGKTGKAPGAPGCPPGTFFSCLRPGIFLFFLLMQTAGFFCYVHFRQELDKSLQECLSTSSLPLSSAAHIPPLLRALRRQPLPPGMHA